MKKELKKLQKSILPEVVDNPRLRIEWPSSKNRVQEMPSETDLHFGTIKVFKLDTCSETYNSYFVNSFVVPDDLSNTEIPSYIFNKHKQKRLSHFIVVKNKSFEHKLLKDDPFCKDDTAFHDCYTSYLIYKLIDCKYHCNEYDDDYVEFSDTHFHLVKSVEIKFDDL